MAYFYVLFAPDAKNSLSHSLLKQRRHFLTSLNQKLLTFRILSITTLSRGNSLIITIHKIPTFDYSASRHLSLLFPLLILKMVSLFHFFELRQPSNVFENGCTWSIFQQQSSPFSQAFTHKVTKCRFQTGNKLFFSRFVSSTFIQIKAAWPLGQFLLQNMSQDLCRVCLTAVCICPRKSRDCGVAGNVLNTHHEQLLSQLQLLSIEANNL